MKCKFDHPPRDPRDPLTGPSFARPGKALPVLQSLRKRRNSVEVAAMELEEAKKDLHAAAESASKSQEKGLVNKRGVGDESVSVEDAKMRKADANKSRIEAQIGEGEQKVKPLLKKATGAALEARLKVEEEIRKRAEEEKKGSGFQAVESAREERRKRRGPKSPAQRTTQPEKGSAGGERTPHVEESIVTSSLSGPPVAMPASPEGHTVSATVPPPPEPAEKEIISLESPELQTQSQFIEPNYQADDNDLGLHEIVRELDVESDDADPLQLLGADDTLEELEEPQSPLKRHEDTLFFKRA